MLFPFLAIIEVVNIVLNFCLFDRSLDWFDKHIIFIDLSYYFLYFFRATEFSLSRMVVKE